MAAAAAITNIGSDDASNYEVLAVASRREMARLEFVDEPLHIKSASVVGVLERLTKTRRYVFQVDVEWSDGTTSTRSVSHNLPWQAVRASYRIHVVDDVRNSLGQYMSALIWLSLYYGIQSTTYKYHTSYLI